MVYGEVVVNGEVVKYVGKTFLNGKDQTLQDYTACMQQPGNHGEELSFYLYARMLHKAYHCFNKNISLVYRQV